ncbi:MAG: ribosomal protein S18-alanine N-acetyltransferase [Methylococcales bacterium]|nr:ribosomal protein S18-alanine N-acetyltransferase [Methylococcales bacterium]
MRLFLHRLKEWVSYDADRDFYAKVFPDSVSRADLIRIRHMFDTDLKQVQVIEQRNYHFPWSEGVFRDCFKAGYQCWVLVEEEEVLGYGITSMAAGEAHILNVSIHPDAQGQGFGRKLLQHQIAQARHRKIEAVFLEVRPSNPGAIALYQSLGFEQVGLRKDYYPAQQGREDALVMKLSLYYA